MARAVPRRPLEGAIDPAARPEARYEQTEAVSLAFVSAISAPATRQLAVLILRDVLGFHADEVADIFDSTVESVKSASNGHAPAWSAGGRRPTSANRPRPRLARRAGDRGDLRPRLRVRPISTRWWPC